MELILCLVILAAAAGFIYWRLRRTNIDIPATAEVAVEDGRDWDGQTVIYIQPHKGENLPRT